MAKKNFLTQFIKNKREVGAIAPSSRFLVRKMLRPINFAKAKVVVELGAGNGKITLEILKKLAPDAILFVFETNKVFYTILEKIKDPRLRLVNDSAEFIGKYLNELDLKEKVDCVISSLPFSLIPNPVMHNILNEVRFNLKSEGVFVQYQYSLGAYAKIKSIFKEVKLDFTPFNAPPAFVYKCIR